MSEIETATPDAYITEQLGELHEANQKGLITCLVMIVFKSDGSSHRLLHGSADPVLLTGSIELLKGFVACQEYANSERMELDDAGGRSLN